MGILSFMFNVFIAMLIPLLGLGFGTIVARVAKEEIKPGRKYFKIFEYLLYFTLLILALWFNFNLGLLIFSVILLLSYFHKNELFFVKFLLFGIIYAIIEDVGNLSEIVISVLFVLGLILATKMKTKNFLDVIFIALIYYLIGYVVSSLILSLIY
jgi:hypothetical protein